MAMQPEAEPRLVSCWAIRLIVALGILAFAVAVPGAEIEFLPSARVQRPVVRLGDVAQITGSDPAELRRLQQVELGPAPPPGQRRLLRASTIRQQLWRRGFAPAEHVFRGASVVEVVRQGVAGSAPAPMRTNDTASLVEQAARRIAGQVLQQWFVDPELRTLWQLETRPDPQQAQSVLESQRLVLVAPRPGSVSLGQEPTLPVPLQGELILRLDTTAGEQTLRLAYQLRQRPAMVVAAAPLARGTVLQRRHLRLVPRRRGLGATEVAADMESVLGLELTRAVRRGEPIRPAALQRPVLVRRGDVVDVVVTAPGVRLRTRGRARGAGARGDVIEVESLLNRKTFFARVVDVQTVQVQAQATTAEVR